jgi:ring-1,2-phenylacetyl-CoA epoxidase subunit PaaC
LICNDTNNTPDRLVFFRDAAGWRNAQMLELPKGDWAFSMMRQYLFDALEMARWPLLAQSAHAQIAAIAAKICAEEIYHYRHTSNWVKRLSLGTEESHRRTQAALDALWPHTAQLLDPLPDEAELVAHSHAPAASAVRAAWEALVLPAFSQWGLVAPTVNHFALTPRANHTPHLEAMLKEMQAVARLEAPEVAW